MWTHFGPSESYLLRVGTLWVSNYGVELNCFGRLGTWTIKFQAADFDRHTTNCHTAIWAEFCLAGRFRTSTNHIQTTMITVMNNPANHRLQSSATTIGDRFQSQFAFAMFRTCVKYISKHSRDHEFQFAVLAMVDINFWIPATIATQSSSLQYICLSQAEGTDFE